MSYRENYYFSEAARLECSGFVTPQNLYYFRHRAQEIKFTYTSERNELSNFLKELHASSINCVYLVDQRFPTRKSYIPLECEEVQAAITQLVNAAAYRPPDVSNTNKDLTSSDATHSSEKEGTSKGNRDNQQNQKDDKTKKGVTITEINERSKFEKSQLAFYQALATLTTAIKTCTLNQATFEAKFNLTWEEVSVPKPPDSEPPTQNPPHLHTVADLRNQFKTQNADAGQDYDLLYMTGFVYPNDPKPEFSLNLLRNIDGSVTLPLSCYVFSRRKTWNSPEQDDAQIWTWYKVLPNRPIDQAVLLYDVAYEKKKPKQESYTPKSTRTHGKQIVNNVHPIQQEEEDAEDWKQI